ncbi:Mbeg1-like protein [Butyrivibrio sp. AE3004]|uniref:Mbeg1-like protein n=1 Tax=Butyrivibrio sp. AE3004 TaxID=1506994 RepID=UPI0004945122|nr:Mbeg1-like protein [Butyrivibrio sp. AE3004]
MANIIDYVQWKGDISFEERPFNIVDNLVFSELGYLEIPKWLMSEGQITIREIWEKLGKSAQFRALSFSDGDILLLEACALSNRFADVVISDYEDSSYDSDNTQFAAMTFSTSFGEKYISFRGTDDTILGWKEDFMISYCKVPAQERALEYLEKIAATGQKFYVGGHSKGANLALYGAAHLIDTKDCIKKVYLNDGPGFCEDVLNADLIRQIDDICVRITPEYCIVGGIFQPEITVDYIVKSSAPQILQHALLSWQIKPEGLDLADGHDAVSDKINSLFGAFIEKMDALEDRQAFVNSIFDTMSQNGAITISDFVKKGPNAFEDLIMKIATDDESGHHPLKKVKESLVQDFSKTFLWKVITEEGETKSIIRICVSLLIAGMCYIIPNSLIQTAFAIAIFAIVAYQVSRSLYYLYKVKWDFNKERVRVNLSIVLIVSYVILIMKDAALLLFSSILFGIFFFISSYQCLARLKNSTNKWQKSRYCFEMVMTFLYGGYLLFSPSVVLGWYMISFGTFMLIDAIFEIIELYIRQRK